MLNKEETEKTINLLVEKSIEAFILGIEIFNKPTIKYRLESLSYHLCVAWELMLKAKLIRDGKTIFYDNERTFSLSHIIGLIYTDKKQPLRINLEKVCKIRHEATHYIVSEYDALYMPFFQANINNFRHQIKKFHNVNMDKYLPNMVLMTSTTPAEMRVEDIQKKYPQEIAEHLIKHKKSVDNILDRDSIPTELYIPIRVELYQTRKREEADVVYSLAKEGAAGAKVIKQTLDPQHEYPLKACQVIKSVQHAIESKSLTFGYLTSAGEKTDFNKYGFDLIVKHFGIKNQVQYCYKFENMYRYRSEVVDFIVDKIKARPRILNEIKPQHKK